MNMRAFVPNLFSCLNLFCGCLGLVFAFNENLVYSSILIGIAALFDFLDGFAARLLNGSSELGKQLDSLADMVTFGVLPGIILYQFIVIGFQEYFMPPGERVTIHVILAFLAFLVPVFSAIRLGKFNLDERQRDRFLGLPTPANAIFIASFPLILEVQYNLNFYYPPQGGVLDYFVKTGFLNSLDLFVVTLMLNPYFYVAVSLIFSILLVLEIPLLALKFKSWGWQRNKTRYLLAGISVLLISTVHFTELYFLVIPIIIFLYIIFSTVYYFFKERV